MKPFKYNPNSHSGLFRHRITFQEMGEGVDADGFPTGGASWRDVKDAWAMIKTLKGTEFFKSAATQNEISSRFVVRYTTDLHPDMQIAYDGRAFAIESIINDDELDETLTIICNEKIG